MLLHYNVYFLLIVTITTGLWCPWEHVIKLIWKCWWHVFNLLEVLVDVGKFHWQTQNVHQISGEWDWVSWYFLHVDIPAKINPLLLFNAILISSAQDESSTFMQYKFAHSFFKFFDMTVTCWICHSVSVLLIKHWQLIFPTKMYRKSWNLCQWYHALLFLVYTIVWWL